MAAKKKTKQDMRLRCGQIEENQGGNKKAAGKSPPPCWK